MFRRIFKMKKYKKIFLVAPIACMLSGGVSDLPNLGIVYAQEIKGSELMKPYDPWDQGDHYSKEKLAETVAIRVRHSIDATPSLRAKFKMKEGEEVDEACQDYIEDTLLDNLQLAAEGSIDIEPHVDSYTDLGQTNLLTYNNDEGVLDQTAQTTSTTISETETHTYSNSEGIKLGLELGYTLDFTIPFMADAGGQLNMTGSVSYDHTDSHTKTQETTITFPSQTVVAAKGGTTTYYGSVTRANFSGSFKSDAHIAGGVTLTLPIVKSYHNKDGMHKETATLSAEDIYDIFVNSAIPLPPYLALDSNGKSVVMTEKTTFNIQGQGGYYSRMQVKFVPKNKTKKPSIMPYEEYVQKVKQRLL
ncbi:hypothetical protein COD86_16520 [Bacillus cereus]|nr:hypothetical protein COD14_31255 [Bacillus cereus]PGV94063.1 hypothetical protein COD86_16520 [Bacillus cereus]